MTGHLAIYTIYFNPSDFPGQYVLRRFSIEGGSEPTPDPEPVFVGASLTEARDLAPPGSVMISRSEGDDPAIVESWL